jgi:hypothetical protein
MLQNLRIIIQDNVLTAAISFSAARYDRGPVSYTKKGCGPHPYFYWPKTAAVSDVSNRGTNSAGIWRMFKTQNLMACCTQDTYLLVIFNIVLTGLNE